jgi:hypothetical protein
MSDPVIVPSPHEEGAKALIAKIRALRDDVSSFVVDAPEQTKKVTTIASVGDPFMESASALLQKSAPLEDVSGMSPAQLRDRYAFARSYDAAVTEAFAFARSLAHTVRVARAAAGESALDIYHFAQRLSRRKDGAELLPHVQDMRRKLKRGRRKATSEPAPATSPSPAPKP